MSKGILSLIRLYEWGVDEKRRGLGELLRLLDNLEQQGARLERELVEEQKVAGESPNEAGFLYGNYARAVIDRREIIEKSIAEMEKKISEAREELNEAYRELKKYQVAQENRDLAEKKEQAREEQLELDEISTKNYLSKLRLQKAGK